MKRAMYTVDVVSGCRLHFGLYRIGATRSGAFGGIGAMVRAFPTWVQVRAARVSAVPDDAHVQGTWLRFVDRCSEQVQQRCEIRIRRRPPSHSGLGSGTQLALATAAALDAFYRTQLSAETLVADIAGRGKRSGIGLHGFWRGGLLVDSGHVAGQVLPQLETRVDLPDRWRVVLIRPSRFDRNIFGDSEEQFFNEASGQDARTTQLESIARDAIVPAATAADFDCFSDALGRFNELSGWQFERFQGGPFNGPLVTELVGHVRRLGWRGVGQSSWGPTVFVATADQGDAVRLVEQLRSTAAPDSLRFTIARFCNRPALVRSAHPRSTT